MSPVAYWNFDETSGKIVKDQIGNADGTWQNSSAAPGWTTGKVGGAAYFPGGDNDKFVVNLDPLNSCTEFTITAWFKMNTLGSYIGLVTTRDLDGSPPLNWGFSAESTHIDSRWNSTVIDSKTLIGTGEWIHIAQTWDSSGKRQLYINGVLDSEANSSVTSYLTDGVWWFGDDPCCSGRELNGYLDEVAMFDKVLSIDDIALIYSFGNSGKKLREIDPLTTFSGSVIESNERLVIYPNPAQLSVNLRFGTPFRKEVVASIYTQTGQLVKQQAINCWDGEVTNYPLNIDGLNCGMYLLVLKSDSLTMQGKFVIEK